MLDDKQLNLVHLLSQPHRISNPRAMMKACEDAAALIQQMDAELDALKKPKRARNTKGQLKADDPSTPNVNEAWEGGKAPR